MAYYQIINWERYQHYKHRSPAWIKLYWDMMTSDTWVMGDDASRALAIACMLLASRTQNKIPADPAYIKKVCYLNHDADFSHLLETGFIELIGAASTALADCKQDASNMLSQSRVEESINTLVQKHPRASRSAPVDPSFQKFWESYPKKTGKGAAEKTWSKIHPDEALTKKILESVGQHKTCDQWTKDHGQYIPLPATWLNQKRWEDEVKQKPKCNYTQAGEKYYPWGDKPNES